MSAQPERTTAEKLELADQRVRKMENYREKLRLVSIAEREIPGAWRGGNDNKQKLADLYGISTMTVTRILSDNGIEPVRTHRLSDEEKTEVIALIKQHQGIPEIAAAYGTSVSTVRKLGVEAGLLEKGQRAAHRTDEEYRLISEFDEEAQKRFGAGLYNLGMGLRSWKKKQAAPLTASNVEAAPVNPMQPAVTEMVGAEHVVADEPQPAEEGNYSF